MNKQETDGWAMIDKPARVSTEHAWCRRSKAIGLLDCPQGHLLTDKARRPENQGKQLMHACEQAGGLGINNQVWQGNQKLKM